MNKNFTFPNFHKYHNIPNMLKDILLKNKYYSTQQDYLNLAEYIIKHNFINDPHLNQQFSLNGINKLIRLLTLDEEYHIFSRTLKYKQHFPETPPFFTLSPHYCPHCYSELSQARSIPLSNTLHIDIALNPTLSFPWNFERLANSLSTIGSNISQPFNYQESNHFNNTLIFPINLLIIGNGYHSSFSGIYDSTAILPAHHVLDISPLYCDIYFDGIAYRHTKCHHILESPLNKSAGIIYEIGRLLTEQNLNLLSLYESK